MNVLVAGGAGYIGSHTVKRLKEAGHYPGHLRQHLPRAPGRSIDILKVPADRRRPERPRRASLDALREHKIDTVMHFAAYAYVGESVEKPLMYYQNNVATTVSVLEAMQRSRRRPLRLLQHLRRLRRPRQGPHHRRREESPRLPLRPQQADGRADPRGRRARRNKNFKFAALRYFNASGCAMDGSIGEDHDPETHLIPVVLQAILGVRPGITVFGTDYPTPDGTNVRDYIHVEDLADAHILAMEKLKAGEPIFCNLGTGRGFSVKEIIAAREKVTGKKAPVTYGPRRAGDAIALYADPSRAKNLLGWEAKHKDPQSIIRSAWNWFVKHPRGYGA